MDGRFDQNIVQAPNVEGSLLDATNLNGCDKIVVEGDRAYVSAPTGTRIAILDIGGQAPVLIGALSNAAIVLGHIAKAGKYIVGTNTADDRIIIIDVSQPETPVLVGNVQDNTNLDEAAGVAIYGSYAVIAATAADAVTLFDITNPADPVLAGTVTNATTLNGATSIAVVGDYAYVGCGAGTRVAAVDLSNPGAPSIINTYVNATSLVSPVALAVQWPYVYVGTNTGLTVVDARDATALALEGTLTDATNLGAITDIKVAGNYAFTASAALDAVNVIDISTPASPTIVATLTSATLMDGASGLDIGAGYLVVSGPTVDTVVKLDIHGMTLSAAEVGSLYASRMSVGDGGAAFNGNVAMAGALTVSESVGARSFTANKGYVTQITSITTAVTLNAACGVITTFAASAAANATQAFTVNNSYVTTGSTVLVSVLSYAGTFSTNGIPVVNVDTVAAGSFQINISNAHGTNALNGALGIGFIVL